MSTRETVITAVINALTGINGQGSYQTTVGAVLDHDLSAQDENTQDIILGVFARGYRFDSNLTKLSHGADVPTTLLIGVRGIVRADANGADDLKSQLINDVGVAIYNAGVNLGLNVPGPAGTAQVRSIDFSNESVDAIGAAAYATFLATITITWLCDPRNP